MPGRASGHIGYFRAPMGDPPIRICGNTPFSGGCGRLFKSTPAQTLHSLSLLAQLPGDTRGCCAHEHTLSSLMFARAFEPANVAAAAYPAWCESRRAGGLPTLPSSIAREPQVNPFLRCGEPAVTHRARGHGAPSGDAMAVLAARAAMSEWKNEFR